MEEKEPDSPAARRRRLNPTPLVGSEPVAPDVSLGNGNLSQHILGASSGDGPNRIESLVDWDQMHPHAAEPEEVVHVWEAKQHYGGVAQTEPHLTPYETARLYALATNWFRLDGRSMLKTDVRKEPRTLSQMHLQQRKHFVILERDLGNGRVEIVDPNGMFEPDPTKICLFEATNVLV